MNKFFHVGIIFLIQSCGLLSAFAQQGDKKEEEQIAPIAEEDIPQSPKLSLGEAMETFQLASGFVLEPLAIGNQVTMPVALNFDEDGRAWVVEMTEYMQDFDASTESNPTGKIKVLEDSNGDGRIDKVTVFLDKLVLPRAATATHDGVLFCHDDKLFFIKREGLRSVGEPVLVDAKYAEGGNAEHKANGLLLGIDNWYYSAKSSKRYRRIDGVWKSEDTKFRGQWGITKDDAGRLYYNNNSTALMSESVRPQLFHGHPYFPQTNIKNENRLSDSTIFPIRMNPGVNRAYQKGILNDKGRLVKVTSACSPLIYRGENFPNEYYGSGFVCATAGNLVTHVPFTRNDRNEPISQARESQEEFLASTDEWFRPVALANAPDGSMWVVDLQFGLIQHKAYMTTYLRDQYASRGLDKPLPSNGRIYRVRYEKNPLSKPPKLSKLSTEQLIPYLEHKNGTVRDHAHRLIVAQLNAEDHSKLKKSRSIWTKFLKQDEFSNKESSLLHALWISESLGAVPADLLTKALKHEDLVIVNSALELSHLSGEKTRNTVIQFKPKMHNYWPYVYALGKIGTEESHQRAIEFINRKKMPRLENAYVSGLGELSKTMLNVDEVNSKKVKEFFQKVINTKHVAGAVYQPELKGKFLESYKRGELLYNGALACAGCHGLNGEGVANLAPPLAPSDWVTEDPMRLTKVILHGLTGPITVNGERYELAAAMPPFGQRPDVTDAVLADLLTFLRNMKGNKAYVVEPHFIKKVRVGTSNRNGKPYTEKELSNP